MLENPQGNSHNQVHVTTTRIVVKPYSEGSCLSFVDVGVTGWIKIVRGATDLGGLRSGNRSASCIDFYFRGWVTQVPTLQSQLHFHQGYPRRRGIHFCFGGCAVTVTSGNTEWLFYTDLKTSFVLRIHCEVKYSWSCMNHMNKPLIKSKRLPVCSLIFSFENCPLINVHTWNRNQSKHNRPS